MSGAGTGGTSGTGTGGSSGAGTGGRRELEPWRLVGHWNRWYLGRWNRRDVGHGTGGTSGPAGQSDTGGTSGTGRRTAGCTAVSGGSLFAEWPMPNPPGLGLPNPQSYTAAGANSILDRVTCLEWQRMAPTSTTYAQAAAIGYCDQLSLDGHDDWRLPTRIELATLVDFTKTSATIDTVAFPGTMPRATGRDLPWVARPIPAGGSRSSTAARPGRTRLSGGAHVACGRSGMLPWSSATWSEPGAPRERSTTSRRS